MIITHLQLHKSQFVPGLFEFKRTINQQFYSGIEMKLHAMGAECRYKGIHFIIPFVNAECIVLADEQEKV